MRLNIFACFLSTTLEFKLLCSNLLWHKKCRMFVKCSEKDAWFPIFLKHVLKKLRMMETKQQSKLVGWVIQNVS